MVAQERAAAAAESSDWRPEQGPNSGKGKGKVPDPYGYKGKGKGHYYNYYDPYTSWYDANSDVAWGADPRYGWHGDPYYGADYWY